MNSPGKPIISVVIPAYNAERTICETIESVLAQSFKDFEILVIDDGSTDSTLQVIKRFVDPRVRVNSFPNLGPSASRNRGIAMARGEYLAFLDADDLWRSHKLASQIEVLQNHPEAILAYSWVDYIDENSQFLNYGTRSQLTGNVYASLLLGNFLENGSNPLIRRALLQEVGGFDEALIGPEDWDYWLRLGTHYPFVLVPKADVLYRKVTGSVSRNTNRMEQNTLQVIAKAFKVAPSALQHLKNSSLANMYLYLTWKALEGCPEHDCPPETFRYYLLALWYEPTILRHPKVLVSIFCEIFVGVLPFRRWRYQWAAIQKTLALPTRKTLLGCTRTLT